MLTKDSWRDEAGGHDVSGRCAECEPQPNAPVQRLRVLIADDHPRYREGLAQLLRQHGIEVVGEAPNGEAAIRETLRTAPDVVIMDLSMPGLPGLEATRRLAAKGSSSRVLAHTVSADTGEVAEALLAGAAGCVLKDGSIEELVDGIRIAARGRSLITPRLAA